MSEVEVVWRALERSWRKHGFEELWLLFRPRGRKDVGKEFERAVEVANRRVDEAGWGGEVFVGAVSETDAGPVASMMRAGPEVGVRMWFAALAKQLESVGLAGRVTAAPDTYLPEWLSPLSLPFQLSAFVCYRTVDLSVLDDAWRRRGWHVPPDDTHSIVQEVTRWARRGGPEVYLSRGLHTIHTRQPDVVDPMCRALAKEAQANVCYLDETSRSGVTVAFSAQGRACYQVISHSAAWAQSVQELLAAVLAPQAELDLAIIQYAAPRPIRWQDLREGSPDLPFRLAGWHLDTGRHLLDRYVPDARGVQVLTDAHLAHARDLSDWDVHPLGDGHHLVQSRDLEAWYAHVQPDPEVLHRARRDFGDMILTPETIDAQPPPL